MPRITKPTFATSKWLTRGKPLLPSVFRRMWREIPLPRWVEKQLKLPRYSTYADLDSTVWDMYPHNAISSDIVNHFVKMYSQQRTNIGMMSCIFPLPDNVMLGEIPWSNRTKILVEKYNLHPVDIHSEELHYCHFEKMHGFGIQARFDYVVSIEHAILNCIYDDNEHVWKKI